MTARFLVSVGMNQRQADSTIAYLNRFYPYYSDRLTKLDGSVTLGSSTVDSANSSQDVLYGSSKSGEAGGGFSTEFSFDGIDGTTWNLTGCVVVLGQNGQAVTIKNDLATALWSRHRS